MKYKRKFLTTDWIPIIGSVASIVGIVIILIHKFGFTSEIIASIASIISGVIAFTAGMYSKLLTKKLSSLAKSKRIFIAYSSQNEDLALDVIKRLRSKGAYVWLAKEKIQPGEQFEIKVSEALDDADSFIALLGKDISPNVLKEISMAKAHGKRIFPVLIDKVSLPDDISGLSYLDLTEGKEDKIQKLIEITT